MSRTFEDFEAKPENELPFWARPKQMPSQAELSKLFSYDAATGKIMSHREAGCVNRLGLSNDNLRQTASQGLAWKLAYGVDPGMIDHINGNPSDNRLCNLREVTQHQNQMNLPVRKGKLLPRGVIQNTNAKTFRAAISIKGKPHYLGSFKTPKEASACYEARAKKEFGDFRRDAK